MSLSLYRRVFLFICLTLSLTLFLAFYAADTALFEFATYARGVNGKKIEQICDQYLSDFANKTAQVNDEIFKRIKATASAMSSHLTMVYNHIDLFSAPLPGETSRLYWNPENQIFFSPMDESVVMAYWADKKISPEIQKEINALTRYKPALMASEKQLAECVATHVITASGIGFYYTTDVNLKKAVYKVPPPSEFDLRDGQPYTCFGTPQKNNRDTQWTKIYKDDVLDGFMMTATTPIYNKAGEFKGITGIDVPVDTIIDGLTRYSALPDVIGKKGAFAFLQNAQGLIIALPEQGHDLFGLNYDYSEYNYSSDVFEFSLKNSSIAAVRNIYPKLLDMDGGIVKLSLKGVPYLLAVGRLKEVGWKLILVVKKTDIADSVSKTALALTKYHGDVKKNNIINALILFSVATGLSALYAAKRFIIPIKKVTRAVGRIAKGDFSSPLVLNRADEIGVLSTSLNELAEELARSEQLKNEYTQDLENGIVFRTRELELTNRKLNRIKDRLEQLVAEKTAQLKKINEYLVAVEERERKNIASDLHDSVAQTLAFSVGRLNTLADCEMPITKDMVLEIKEPIIQALSEIRMMIYQLRPPLLDDFEIDVAIGYLVEGYKNNYSLNIDYENNSNRFLKTSPDLRVTIYRVSNELISNVLKHAKAENTRLELSNTDETIFIEVEDDGIGFDLTQIQRKKYTSVGLASMSERIQNLGGRFKVASRPGKGTKIRVSLPC